MSVVSEAQAAAIMGRYLNKDDVVLAALDVSFNVYPRFAAARGYKHLTGQAKDTMRIRQLW